MVSSSHPPQERPVTALPDPDECPSADVVLFDGECRFCRGGAARIHRLDGKNRVAFMPLQDERVAERYPQLSYERLMSELVLVEPSGESHGGVAAFRHLSRRLPKLWWLAPLLHIPGSLGLWAWVYRFIAKRRYLIGGQRCENGTCKI